MLGNNFVVILVIIWHVRDRKPTYRLQYLLYTATKFGLNEVGCCLIDTETDRVGLKVSEVQLMHFLSYFCFFFELGEILGLDTSCDF